MTPERWKRTEDLYHQACARLPADRAAFLAEACCDDEPMRRNVESLLAESESDDGFLAEPALAMSVPTLTDFVSTTMAGASLGGYQLQALLGAGGMGEVYQAHDSRLGRDVAIKILPRAFTSHPDRLARFEREARMLASLNHPNICGIYGIEESDGIRFLVLELVEGETLADKVAQMTSLHAKGGGLPLGDVLAISRQITHALEVAHDKGIIHRDLKPANIKITPDGAVKVLDFGLAKAVGGEGAPPDLSNAPVEDGARRAGAVIGTAAYMSPEQARGLAVDKRTDIWAFGCVLYEMLTGRVTFAGDTVSDSIAKILEREPDWSVLPALTPPSLRRLLLRCLAKDPKKRLRDIGDVRIELDAIDEGPAAASETARPAARKASAIWLPWVALALLAAAGGAWEVWRAVPTVDPMARATLTELTHWEGTEERAEISRDGRFVAFIADRDGQFDLWWSEVGTEDFRNNSQELDSLDFQSGILRNVGFSGDGSQLWFALGQRKGLRIMPQAGGKPQSFLGLSDHSPAWFDSNRLVFSSDTNESLSVEEGGRDAQPIEIRTSDADRSAEAGRKVHYHNPVWSQDGKWIYYVRGFINEFNKNDEMDIWRVSPNGGWPERLTHLKAAVHFLAVIDADTLLYVAREEDGSGPWLWALDLTTKASRRALPGFGQTTSVAASRDGRRVVVTRANPSASLWTVPILDGQAEERDVRPLPGLTGRALAPRYARDARSSLFYLSARVTRDGLWSLKDGKSDEFLKGAEGPLFYPPAPSPDGRVAVVQEQKGKHLLTILSANGTEPRTLARSLDTYGTADWSPDNKMIAAGGIDDKLGRGLFLIPVDSPPAGEPVLLAPGEASHPVFSPDGDFLVYSGSFTAGQAPLKAVRTAGKTYDLPAAVGQPVGSSSIVDQRQLRISPGGYRFRDRTRLVYLDRPDPESMDFWEFDLRTGNRRQLTRLSNKGSLRWFDITPDGKHIVFDRVRQNGDIVLIDLPKK